MTAPRLLHRTRCHCCDCGAPHAAEIVEDGGAVYLELACPVRGLRRARLSSDASLYQAIRSKHAARDGEPVSRDFSWVNFVEITRDCNARCPICYADSRPGAGGYLSVAEVLAIARRLRGEGLKAISLTGGEPTLHPRLVEIVSGVRALGLDVTVISNGLRLGADPALARRLRRAGLTYLYLQADTLRPEIHRRLRGDEQLAPRLRAFANAARAGLRFGLDATIVRDNLDEVGDLLRHAAGHAPRLGVATFLTAARTGRFLLEDEVRVTREDIIAALCRSGAVEGLRDDHFWPFPRFAPLGLDLHPDCGVILLLALDRGRLHPLDELVDIAELWRRLGAAGGPIDRRRAALLFSLSFLRALRRGAAAPIARMLAGLLSGRGRSSILTVVVEQYADGELLDEERLERCTTCSVLGGGRRIPMCLFQHADPRRSPDTRVARAARSSP